MEIVENTLKLWSEAKKYFDSADKNPFSELVTFALTLLPLPWSNAKVQSMYIEHMMKTKLRSRLEIETLNAILNIR